MRKPSWRRFAITFGVLVITMVVVLFSVPVYAHHLLDEGLRSDQLSMPMKLLIDTANVMKNDMLGFLLLFLIISVCIAMTGGRKSA